MIYWLVCGMFAIVWIVATGADQLFHINSDLANKHLFIAFQTKIYTRRRDIILYESVKWQFTYGDISIFFFFLNKLYIFSINNKNHSINWISLRIFHKINQYPIRYVNCNCRNVIPNCFPYLEPYNLCDIILRLIGMNKVVLSK